MFHGHPELIFNENMYWLQECFKSLAQSIQMRSGALGSVSFNNPKTQGTLVAPDFWGFGVNLDW